MGARTDGSADAGRTRNRRGEGGRLGLDIVAAATELLDEGGSADAVTLRAVARRVGVTAPAIYPHFDNPQAILLAVVRQEFARLHDHLHAAVDTAPQDALARLRAWCAGYLDYAALRPQRYLVLFGGVWNAQQAARDGQVATTDVDDLGRAALDDVTAMLQRCVDLGYSSSTDVPTDAVALWTGLHGLAHQRIVATAFPWPAGLDDRLIESLAHLTPRP